MPPFQEKSGVKGFLQVPFIYQMNFMPATFLRPFLCSYLMILQNSVKFYTFSFSTNHSVSKCILSSCSLICLFLCHFSHFIDFIQFLSTFKNNYCSHLKALRTLKVKVQFFSHQGIFHL